MDKNIHRRRFPEKNSFFNAVNANCRPHCVGRTDQNKAELLRTGHAPTPPKRSVRLTTGADVGRGLALRMDHGSQYTAEVFLNQIKFCEITPSFAFVAEPQANGVTERFNRTLKEQVFHGRIFKNLAAVRTAVAEFEDRYNRRWRLEKTGIMTPLEVRHAYTEQMGA